jgi:hypothetical protein
MANENVSVACVRRAAVTDAAQIARLVAQFGHPVTETELRERIAALGALPSQYLAVAQGSSTNLVGWIQAVRVLVLTAGERALDHRLGGRCRGTPLRCGIAPAQSGAAWACATGVAQILMRANVQRDSAHVFYLALGYNRSKTQHVYAKTLLG